MTGKPSGNAVAPTTTVLPARVRIFQPSQRPRYQASQWLESPWGRAQVTGRLGQRHADLMESILYCAEDSRDVEDGGIMLLVDPAKVRREMSQGQYSYQQIEKLLIELRSATVTIHTEQFDFPIIGGLIDHVKPSPMTRYDPLTKQPRNMWRVRLGVALVMLLEHDLSLYYEPAPIARLQHGVSQAIARHILTHKNDPAGGWHVDTLIRAVCGEDASSKTMRNGRYRIKEDEDGLRELGIEITADQKIKRLTPAR